MSEQEFRELFRRLVEIYKLKPEVAQELLRRIMEILHGENGAEQDEDGG